MDDAAWLHVGTDANIPISMEILPGISVVSLLADTFGIPQGVPEVRRRPLRKACSEYLADTTRPLASAGFLRIPETLSMGGGIDGGSMEEEIRRISETSPGAFLADLERMSGGDVPPMWRKVVDNPSGFLAGYAALARTVWDSMALLWQRAKPLLEREIGRVGIASVTESMPALLAGLSPRISFTDGVVGLPGGVPGQRTATIHRMTLMPLVSGTRACVHRVDESGHAYLGYPLAGLAPLLRGEEARTGGAADALALTLGELRAVILRKGGQPVSMGRLADMLHCTAGTVTYHCRQLEQAGLLSRERRGREVRISRTLRGDALVDALS